MTGAAAAVAPARGLEGSVSATDEKATMRHVLALFVLALSADVCADTVTFCLVELQGVATQPDGTELVSDRMEQPITVSMSTENEVSVFPRTGDQCHMAGNAIVCASENIVETFAINRGVVYYTLISSAPSLMGLRALVGRVGEC